MNTKTGWRIRLAWARWRVRILRSRVWGLRRRLVLQRPQRDIRQLELPFRSWGPGD